MALSLLSQQDAPALCKIYFLSLSSSYAAAQLRPVLAERRKVHKSSSSSSCSSTQRAHANKTQLWEWASVMSQRAPVALRNCHLLSPISFKVRCVVRSEMVFELLLPFSHLDQCVDYSPQASPIDKAFSSPANHWVFSLFQTILCKP